MQLDTGRPRSGVPPRRTLGLDAHRDHRPLTWGAVRSSELATSQMDEDILEGAVEVLDANHGGRGG